MPKKAVVTKEYTTNKRGQKVASYNKTYEEIPQTDQQIKNRVNTLNKSRLSRGENTLLTPEQVKNEEAQGLPVGFTAKQQAQGQGQTTTPQTQQATQGEVTKEQIQEQVKGGVQEPIKKGQGANAFETALNYISAPLSQPITTLTQGLGAGAEAVKQSREVIKQEGVGKEFAKVVGTTALTSWIVGSLGLAVASEIPAGAAASVGTKILGTSLKVKGLGALFVGGSIVGGVKLKVNTAKTILSESEGQLNDILTEVKEGRRTLNDSLPDLERINSNIRQSEAIASKWSKLDVGGFLGMKDVLISFEGWRKIGEPSYYAKLAELENERLQAQAFQQQQQNLFNNAVTQ